MVYGGWGDVDGGIVVGLRASAKTQVLLYRGQVSRWWGGISLTVHLNLVYRAATPVYRAAVLTPATPAARIRRKADPHIATAPGPECCSPVAANLCLPAR